jgi:iron complex transport system ATP-binding protein
MEGKGRWLLLDEPTASLDPRHQHDILRIVRRFADSGGCVVVVLHDLNLCARYADKVCLLHFGRVLGSGDAAAVMTSEWLSIAYGVAVHCDEARGARIYSL